MHEMESTQKISGYQSKSVDGTEGGNFSKQTLDEILGTNFHTSTTSEGKFFQMSHRIEAYLESFVTEDKLPAAKQQVASVVKDMYTHIFSVIQPVIEDNVEKLISIGRDLAGNKVKRSDQGLNCNLTEEVCNAKEHISTNPSSSIDSRKGCSASQHSQSQNNASQHSQSQSQSQAEISCSQKQSFAVPHSGITNFVNTLSSGENSDSHPTIKTKNSADCQKSTCATVDVIKQDGETRCDKQPEKAQEDNTIHEKDVDAADNTCVNSPSDTKKDVAAQHGKGCSASQHSQSQNNASQHSQSQSQSHAADNAYVNSPSDTKKDVAAQHGKGCSASQHSQSQNNASQHSQSQSQDHTEISCSLPKKSSSELKHIKEVYEMDLIEAISDECKAQCQHMINYINTCLDCLPIHSPFEPILDMIESGAYIKTCENSDSDEATLLHKNCVDCQSKICATEHRIQGKGDVATCETTTAKCVNQTQKAHANSTPLADKSTLPVQCSASVKVDGTCTPLVAAAYNQQQTCVTSQAENLLEVKGDVSASEKSTTKCANQPEKDEAGKTPLPAQPVPTVAHPKNISKADVSMNKVKKRSLLDYFDIIKRDKRVKISDPSIEGASKQAEAQMISDAGNYIHLSDDTFLYDADNTFFYDDEFWIKAFKVVEQSQKCASDEPNPENNLNFPQHQLEAQSYSQKPEGPIPQGNNSSHSTEEASALQ